MMSPTFPTTISVAFEDRPRRLGRWPQKDSVAYPLDFFYGATEPSFRPFLSHCRPSMLHDLTWAGMTLRSSLHSRVRTAQRRSLAMCKMLCVCAGTTTCPQGRASLSHSPVT